MKNKVYYLIIISVLFIVFGFTILYKNDIFFGRSLGTSLNMSTYGKIHFISTTKTPTSGSDAILIESQGKLCLIDSGNPESFGSTTYTGEDGKKVADYIKSIGGTRLDCIIGTHAHSDHIGGIPQIVNEGLVDSNTSYYYKVYEETLEDTNQPSWDNRGYYDRAIAALRSKTNNLIDVTNNANVNITVGQFNIKLLNTESWSARGNTGVNPDENRNSIVEYVTIGSNKALLTADLVKSDENRLISNGLIGKVDILKLGHHGAASSSGYDFINTTNPKTAIVTGSASLRTSQRNVGALKQLTENGADIFYTGNVEDAIVVNFNETSYSVANSDDSSIDVARPTLNFQNVSVWTRATLNTGVAWYIFNEHYEPLYTGWKKINEKQYHFNTNTGVASRGWEDISGVRYFFATEAFGDFVECEMVTGWLKSNNNWYYFDNSGAMQTGWKEISDKNNNKHWYFFNSSGVMQTGWQEIGDKNHVKQWYYFDSSGAMQTGWKKIDELYYLLNDDGSMFTGWYQSPDTNVWYYLLPSRTSGHPKGSMAVNMCINIDGTRYCFDQNGRYETSNKSIAVPPDSSYCRSNIIYNGSNQIITKNPGVGYTFSGTSVKNAGQYTVTANLNDGYMWNDNTSSKKTFQCSIGKATASLSGLPSSINVNNGDSLDIDFVTNTAGTVQISSSNGSISLSSKTISASANTNNKVTISGLNVGNSLINIKFSPTDTSNYNGIEKNVSVTINDSGSADRTLTIIPNGGSWNNSKDNVTYNLSIGEAMNIVNPVRSGYTFKGWTISNNSTIINGTTLTMGNINTTITASWERKSYTIKFNANGGKGSMSDLTQYYNVTFTLPTNSFSRDGYSFKGWSTSPTGNVIYNNLAVVNNVASDNENTKTLYAIWQSNTFIVEYYANGGVGTMTSSTSSNGVVKLKKCTFDREGYTFLGWSNSAAGSVLYSDESTVNNVLSVDNIKLYAQWIETPAEVVKYKVQYDANGGTGTMDDFDGIENTSIVLRKNIFKRDNYRFGGWSTTPDGEIVYTDEATITLSNSMILYAKWLDTDDYWNVIEYAANGGTGTMINSLFYPETDIKLNKNAFVRDGYTFVGWSTTPDGEVEFRDEDITNFQVSNVSLKLYAVWKDTSTSYTIIEKIPDTLKFSNKFILLLGILLFICGAFIIKKVIKKET